MIFPAHRRTAYIFTHDIHLDRRIVAQAEPLVDLGLEPVIFAGPGSGAADTAPYPVLRPPVVIGAPRLRVRIARLILASGLPGRLLRDAWRTFRRAPATVVDFSDFTRDVYDFTSIQARATWAIDSGEVPSPPALVVVNDLPTLPVGLLVAERFGCPLVVDCHEWWAEQARLFLPGDAVAIRAAAFWEAALYPRCDLRITVGETLAGEMGKAFGLPFATVRSACPAPGFGRTPSFWGDRLGLPAGAKVAMFQGSLAPLRNLETLAASAGQLRDGQFLVVVGDGVEKEKMARAARQAGAEARIRFTGWVEQERLLEWTVNADLGVLPYITLNDYYALSCPNKLFEFLAARLPVVYDPGMREIDRTLAADGLGLPVDARSPESLGRAMADLLADDSRRAGIAGAYERVGDRHLWPAQRKRLADLIRPLLTRT